MTTPKQLYIEIRDDGTLIPALIIELPNNPCTVRAGYSGKALNLILMKLVDCKAEHDPHKWVGQGRTMKHVHLWIYDNWEAILRHAPDGFLIDVEFMLGERTEPKKSELGDWTR